MAIIVEPTVRRAASLVSVGVALTLGVAGPKAADAQRSLPSTTRLVARVADYIRDYEIKFQFLIADETVDQRVAPAAAADEPIERRRTTGEMFITYLGIEHQWTVVHDVADVDGVPVADRADLTALARDEEISSVARRVFALNARYNLGPVVRNFNDPMLALLPLSGDRRPRFSFSTKRVQPETTDELLAVLAFEERERPTLIRDTQGRSVFAKGDLIIDTTNGVIRHARIALSHDNVNAELVTEFALDQRLGLWLPTVFKERYASNRDGRALVTTCESHFSNYRRFEVTGRVR